MDKMKCYMKALAVLALCHCLQAERARPGRLELDIGNTFVEVDHVGSTMAAKQEKSADSSAPTREVSYGYTVDKALEQLLHEAAVAEASTCKRSDLLSASDKKSSSEDSSDDFASNSSIATAFEEISAHLENMSHSKFETSSPMTVLANYAHNKMKPKAIEFFKMLLKSDPANKSDTLLVRYVEGAKTLFNTEKGNDVDLKNKADKIFSDACNPDMDASGKKSGYKTVMVKFDPPMNLNIAESHASPLECVKLEKLKKGETITDDDERTKSYQKLVKAFKEQVAGTKTTPGLLTADTTNGWSIKFWNKDRIERWKYQGTCYSCEFSKELRARAKKENKDFYWIYAEGLLTEGSFRSNHLKKILDHIGVASSYSSKIAAKYGPSMVVKLADTKANYDVLQAETSDERNHMTTILQHVEDGKNPMEELLEMAREIQSADEEAREAKLVEFVDVMPVVLSEILNDDSVKERIRRVISTAVQYIVENPKASPEGGDESEVEIPGKVSSVLEIQKGLHFVEVDSGKDSTAVVEQPADLELAPDQMRMFNCGVAQTSYGALLQMMGLEDQKRSSGERGNLLCCTCCSIICCCDP